MRDLGNFVAEQSDGQGRPSLHILLLGAKGIHATFGGYGRPNGREPFDMASESDYKWLRPVFNSLLPDAWTLVDLLPFRQNRIADLTPEWRRTINGYDLMIVAPEFTPSDTFGQVAMASVPAPRFAAHQHLISPQFAPIVKAPQQDAAALVKLPDAAKIDRGVVLSMAYSFAAERKKIPDPDRNVRDENDWTSQQVLKSGRLVGFCSVNLLRDEAVAEVERCLKLPGIIGLKLHFGNSGVSLRVADDVERTRRVFAAANARHAPIIVHLRARSGPQYGAEDALLLLEKLLPYAPNSMVQVAHLAGSGPGFPREAQDVFSVLASAIQRKDRGTRLLYFDEATAPAQSTTAEEGREIARAIRRLGPNGVFFGSDMAIGDNPTPAQAWEIFLAKVPLTQAEFRTIASNVPPYMRRSVGITAA